MPELAITTESSACGPMGAAIHQSPEFPNAICAAPRYRHGDHVGLPHLVKFSGGRSSGAMLLSLAKHGALVAERGDAVLFANTTAEHPSTYQFAIKVCDEIESEYNIPCFWYEYCTVEKLGRLGYSRRPAYKLVTRQPYSKADELERPGYRSDGSAFEEMISALAMLPDRHIRICTHALKVKPGARLISEWLGGGPGPAYAGHHHGSNLVTADELGDRYRGGKLTKDQYIKRVQFAATRPPARPDQVWQEFTKATLDRSSTGARPKADIWGILGKTQYYVTLLGLRGDEQDRVDRMLMKNLMAEGASSSRCRDTSQPAGELAYAPMADYGTTVEDISSFWTSHSYDLGIDSKFGNCVFCFMKGPVALSQLAHTVDAERVENAPSDISWWANIENRYARPTESDDGRRLGFFDLTRPTYAEIAAGPIRVGRQPVLGGPCACTD